MSVKYNGALQRANKSQVKLEVSVSNKNEADYRG